MENEDERFDAKVNEFVAPPGHHFTQDPRGQWHQESHQPSELPALLLADLASATKELREQYQATILVWSSRPTEGRHETHVVNRPCKLMELSNMRAPNEPHILVPEGKEMTIGQLWYQVHLGGFAGQLHESRSFAGALFPPAPQPDNAGDHG